MAIALVIIPIYFVERGISLPITTLVIGIISIPMTIKFVWGGIVDYFIRFGRKRFIILGGLLFAGGLSILTVIDPSTALIPFTFFLFISVCGVGFLDVSADAWAIEISREAERGKINGAMFAGQYAGLALGSSLLAFIAKIFGYNISFLVTGLIVFLIILFPFIVKEVKIIKKRQKVAKLLIGEFRKRTTQLIAIFMPIVDINKGMLIVLIPLYMKTVLQLDIAQIGLIVAIFPVTAAVGSLVGGAIADKWNKRRTLYVFIGASICLSASLIFANTWQILAIIYGVIGFLQGGYMTATCAMCMDVTNPRTGATQFSILTSLGNAGMTGGETISGTLIAMFGFSRTFLYSAWIFGPALLILYFIRLKKHVKKINLFNVDIRFLILKGGE
ncbi:MAG: MFS transporter [Thermoplasmatales archaeon]|nr:MFS transporter [Thermoplasmatales archaeon]